MYSGSNRNFIQGDHHTLNSMPDSSYDLIIAIGVLHHINDLILEEFLKESYRLLRPGGRLTTFDPVLHNSQSKLSRWVVKRDRGEWVRGETGYIRPIQQIFNTKPISKIYSNLLKIPYDHIAIDTTKLANKLSKTK
jgi:ubiquinone/menaquinone biosynthesis C-methylase UbiE